MSVHDSSRLEKLPDDLRDYFKGRRVLIRIYDVPAHIEYEQGVRGTIVRFLPNLSEISVSATGHLWYPVVIEVLLDEPISDEIFGTTDVIKSQKLVLALHDVQILMGLIRHGSETVFPFSPFTASMPRDDSQDLETQRWTDLWGLSKDANVELI